MRSSVFNIFSNKHQGRLGRQTTIYILAMSSILTAFSILWQVYSDLDGEIHRVEEGVSKTEGASLPPLARSLWNLDHDQIQLILSGIEKLEGVAGVRVLEPSGKVFKQLGTIDGPGSRLRSYPLVHKAFGQEFAVGSLQLAVSYEDLYLHLRSKLFRIALSQMIKTFLMSFLIIAIIERLVTRHLRSLEAQVKNMSLRSKFDLIKLLKTKATEPDEIDQVVDAINRLLQENDRAMQEVQKVHNERLVMMDELFEAQRGVALHQLASGVIHDLNNYLAIISATASVQKMVLAAQVEQVDPKLHEQLSKLVEKMELASDGASRVANLQLNTRKDKVLPEILSVEEIVRAVLLMQERTFARHQIEVQVKVDAKLNIFIPKGIILTILINLLKNATDAFDAMPDDHRPHIIISGEALKNGFTRLSIQDNGPGLPAEVLENLFNHGFTTKQTGHGFGLHFCKNLLNSYHGEISATNASGTNKGAIFVLEMPSHSGLMAKEETRELPFVKSA